MELGGNLQRKIADQVDYILSRDNLEDDTYLQRSMDQAGYVNIADLVSHTRVKNLCRNIGVLAKALEQRPHKFQIHKDGTRVRRRDSVAKCYLVLRGPPQETSVDQVKNLFKPSISAAIALIEFVYQNVWYVYFYEDGLAQEAIQYVCEFVPHFKGNVVTARVKTLQSPNLPSNSITANTVSGNFQRSTDYSGFYADGSSFSDTSIAQDTVHWDLQHFPTHEESNSYDTCNQYDPYEDSTCCETIATFNNSMQKQFEKFQEISLPDSNFNLDIAEDSSAALVSVPHHSDNTTFPSYDHRFNVSALNSPNNLQATLPVNPIPYLPYPAPKSFPVTDPSQPVFLNPLPIASDLFNPTLLQLPASNAFLATNIGKVVDFVPSRVMTATQFVPLIPAPGLEFQQGLTFCFDAESTPFIPSRKLREPNNMPSIFPTPLRPSESYDVYTKRSKSINNMLHDDAQFEINNRNEESTSYRPNCNQYNFNPKMPSSKKSSKSRPSPRSTRIIGSPQSFKPACNSLTAQEPSNTQDRKPMSVSGDVDTGINPLWCEQQKAVINDFQNNPNLSLNCSGLRPKGIMPIVLLKRETVDELHTNVGTVRKNEEISSSENSYNYSRPSVLGNCPRKYETAVRLNRVENRQVFGTSSTPSEPENGYSRRKFWGREGRSKLQKNDEEGSEDPLLTDMQNLTLKINDASSNIVIIPTHNFLGPLKTRNVSNKSSVQFAGEMQKSDSLPANYILGRSAPSKPRKAKFLCDNCRRSMNPGRPINTKIKFKTISMIEGQQNMSNCAKLSPINEDDHPRVLSANLPKQEVPVPINHARTHETLNLAPASTDSQYTNSREDPPDVNQKDVNEFSNSAGLSDHSTEKPKTSSSVSNDLQENLKVKMLAEAQEFPTPDVQLSSDSKTVVKDSVQLSYAAVTRTFYPTKTEPKQASLEKERGTSDGDHCNLKPERTAPAIIVSRSIAKGFWKSFGVNPELGREDQSGLKRP